MKSAPALLACIIMLVGCGSAGGRDAGNGRSQSKQVAKAAAKQADASTFKVGINVSSINNWGGTRPFLNLIYGSSWQMQNTKPWGGYEDVPSSSLDAHGWVTSVPSGYRVLRSLSVPLYGGNFICRYRGNGTLSVSGSSVSNVVTAAGSTRFALEATYPNPKSALIDYTVDRTNYIRDIDCRESTIPPTGELAPEFAEALSGFKIVRFMDWQTATGTNAGVSWSTRNKPGDGDYLKNDGVPVELILQLANQVGADPWVTIPWNADGDYVTRYATYVRDNLASGHRVYVEVSNEVWNTSSPVGIQACSEAKAENLPGINGGLGCNLERYAEKTKQVMQIWSNVFSSQPNKLVRVASLQHVSPYWTNATLQYENLYQSIDALATAPYFGDEITESMNVDQIMAALHTDVDSVVALGAQQKTIAQKYGIRYITYEGGQTVLLPNNVSLERQVERDQRMYDVYKQLLTAWQIRLGDNLTLYNLAGGISRYGAWGLSEYVGQPLAQAPKLHAVDDFLGLSHRRLALPSSIPRRRSVRTRR